MVFQRCGRAYFLPFFLVDFFAFFAVFFLAAISWLLRVGVCSSVRRIIPDAVNGMMIGRMLDP